MAVVTGIAEARRALRNIERKAQNASLRKATRIVADEAKRTAPRRSGGLRQSIRTAGRGQVRASARYAPFVHYGTRRQRPQPFFWDAYNRRRRDITEAYVDEIDGLVKVETRRALGRVRF